MSSGSNRPQMPDDMLAGPSTNPAVASSSAFSAQQQENGNMPTITSVAFDGFLSDCTVCHRPPLWCHATFTNYVFWTGMCLFPGALIVH